MRKNIATVKAHTPVLGKLARMRQMQGKASRLDIGLAAFSERVAQRVMKRGSGQWRRFSLDYLMDEEKEQQLQQPTNAQQNIDLDVVFQLHTGGSDSGAQREVIERQVEMLTMRTLTRLQPELLLSKYDIHHTAQSTALPVQHSEAGKTPIAPAQSGSRETQTIRNDRVEHTVQTLMERALRTERITEKQTLRDAKEFAQTRFYTEKTLYSERKEEKKTQIAVKELQQKGSITQQIYRMNHTVRKIANASEMQNFAQNQMRQMQDVASVQTDRADMRRAGDVLREQRWIIREMPVSQQKSMQQMSLTPMQPIANARSMKTRAQLFTLGDPLKPMLNGAAQNVNSTDAVQQMRQRNRFQYGDLTHVDSGENAAQQSMGSAMQHMPADHAVVRYVRERTQSERASVLWRVLERSSERLLSNVLMTAAMPGEMQTTQRPMEGAIESAIGTERNTERLITQQMRTHTVWRGQLPENTINKTEPRMARTTTIRPAFQTSRDAQPVQRVEAGNLEGHTPAQERVRREVQLRSRLGVETLIHAQSMALPETMSSEDNTMLREIATREVQKTTEHSSWMHMLREVLMRSSEHMLRSVERGMGVPGRNGLAGASGMNGMAGRSGAAGFNGRNGLAGASGMNGIAGHSGAAGIPGREGLPGTSGMSGMAGRSGAAGRSGREGLAGTAGVEGNDGIPGKNGVSDWHLATESRILAGNMRVPESNGIYNNITYNDVGRTLSTKEKLMRQVEMRSRFGLETLIYAQEFAVQTDAATNGERSASTEVRTVRTRAERSQILRNVLERTTDRMLHQLETERIWMPASTDGAVRSVPTARVQGERAGNARRSAASLYAGRAHWGSGNASAPMSRSMAATANGVQTASMSSVRQSRSYAPFTLNMDASSRSSFTREQSLRAMPLRAMQGAEQMAAQNVPRSTEQRLVREIELRSRFDLETLTYVQEGAQDAQEGAQTTHNPAVLHQTVMRAVERVSQREAMLRRPNMVEAMSPILHSPGTMAKPIRTAVEGQSNMTVLMRKREEDAPRSVLEMIARAGQGESPLRSSILTQPAEIVMYVPPTTMSVYGTETPRVGNLSWEEKPTAESRATPQAALRLMQKAQQKFGTQARYRPPEMVMKEAGDTTGKLASQQVGQPRSINQEMRAKKTVIRENAPQELTNTEITRIVDKVYDKIERKIATEYRRRGR